MHGTFQRWIGAFGNRDTGAAWLSSARVVRCWVKSRNERNPCPSLPARNGGNSKETAGDKPEEGGDDVKSSWPLRPGLHTYYNGKDRGLQTREGKPIPETFSQSRSEEHTSELQSLMRISYAVFCLKKKKKTTTKNETLTIHRTK